MARPACKFSILLQSFVATLPLNIFVALFMPDACFLMKLSKLLPLKGNNFSSYNNCSVNHRRRGICVSHTGWKSNFMVSWLIAILLKRSFLKQEGFSMVNEWVWTGPIIEGFWTCRQTDRQIRLKIIHSPTTLRAIMKRYAIPFLLCVFFCYLKFEKLSDSCSECVHFHCIFG